MELGRHFYANQGQKEAPFCSSHDNSPPSSLPSRLVV